MGRPREHGAETRELLLTAAARLLNEEGATALSVRRLTSEVDVSGRAVYSLFGDMRGLLAALYRRGFETMAQLHEEVPRQDDPLAEILCLAMAYRRAALEQRELYGLMFERTVPSFSPDGEDIVFAMRSLERVQDAVARAIGPGQGRDPRTVALQMWAVVHGLASLELKGVYGEPEAAVSCWHEAVSAMTAGLFPAARSDSDLC